MVSVVSVPLDAQVRYAGLIVDATVAEVLPDVTETVTLEPGSAEAQIQAKQGLPATAVLTSGRVEFTVNDVWKGASGRTVVLRIPPIGLDSVPDFQPGDRFVLLLQRYDDTLYGPAGLPDGFWYVAPDLRVYPAGLTPDLQQYSGAGLPALKSTVKAIERKG